jgi:hypothetical protein
LFTDGLANQGITTAPEIIKGVEKYLKSIVKPVSIFSFGFGADHDSNMLRSIAESGNGLYYYLERSDEIPQSFADCLGGLLSVVAQNIKLTIETVDNGVQIKALHSIYKKLQESPTSIQVALGDLYSEEQRDIVLEVTVPELRSELDRMELVKFTLSYFDVIETSSEELENSAIIERPAVETSERVVNPELDKQRARVESSRALEESRKLAEKGDLEEARNVLRKQQQRNFTSPNNNQDRMVQAINNDMDDLISNMSSPQQYQQQGHHQINSVFSSIQAQRSNKKSSTFETSSKRKMQEKWDEQKK